MFTPQPLARALWIAGLPLLIAMPATAAADDDRFLAAMRLYHDSHYGAAYQRLAELADGGHAESARIALLMRRFGPSLYRSHWSATALQVQRWLQLASRSPPLWVAGGTD